MVYGIRVGNECVTVELSGTWMVGPKHDRTIREIVAVMHEAIRVSNARRVELDLRDLQYAGGDSISWIWVAVHKSGLECSVRAQGEAKELLSELMEIGLRVPITD